MALLTLPTRLPDAQNFAKDAASIHAEMAQQELKRKAEDRLQVAQMETGIQAALLAQRRSYEFDSKLAFDERRTAADDRRADSRLAMEREIFLDDRTPYGGSGGSPAPSQSIPALPSNSTPAAPATATPTPAPRPTTTPAADALALPMEDSPTPEGTDTPVDPAAAAAEPSVIPGLPSSATAPPASPAASRPTIPVAQRVVIQPDGTRSDAPAPPMASAATIPGLPSADAAPGELIPPTSAVPPPASPAQRIRELDAVLRSLPMVDRKTAREVLRGAVPQIVRETTAASRGVTAPMASWPKNERGYRFDPANPASQFEERWSPRGATFKAVKESDPWYGYTPVGDGLYEDRNGGRFFVEHVRNGAPMLKRVEQDEQVSFHTTDSTGKIHSFNKFGKQVGVTDDDTSFLKPSTRPMVGSDGNVYAYDTAAGKFATPPPAGVRFDRAADVKTFRVGTDGKMYGWKADGNPATDIPVGVRFDHPPDPEKVTMWKFDETAKKLVGFNYKGDPIAQNEGQFSKLSAAQRARKEASLPESATYESLKPHVHALWSVYDKIRDLTGDPNSPPEDLRRFGAEGMKLVEARTIAQTLLENLKMKGKKPGINFAEGFVRSYEARLLAAPAAPAPTPAAAPSASTTTPTATPAPTATPSPAAPAATPAPAGPSTWRNGRNGWEYEYTADGHPTGSARKLPTPTAGR